MSLRILYYSLFFLLGYLPIISSQELPTSTYGFKNITIEDGLSQNSVVGITKDSLGLMWFSTRDGLNRFDGNSFKKYHRLFDLELNETSSKLGQLQIYGNSLWMITKGGKLEKMNTLNEEFYELDIPLKNLPPIRTFFVENENRIWYGTETSGVYLLDSQFEILRHFRKDGIGNSKLNSNTVNKIFKDSYQKIWILTDKGVHEISKNGNILHLQNSNTTAVTQSANGALWIGTKGDGLFVKDFHMEDFFAYRNHRSNLLNAEVLIEDIAYDNFKLWIGTFNKGIFILDLNYGDIQNFLPNSQDILSIGSRNILSVFPDGEGGTWVGMDRGGISYFNDAYKYFERPVVQSGANLLGKEVGGIVTDSLNTVWYITNDNFLNRYNTETEKSEVYDLKDMLGNDRRKVNAVSQWSDVLWLASENAGIKRLKITVDPPRVIKEADPINSLPTGTNITAFLKNDKQSVLAASSNSNVFLLDRDLNVLKKFSCMECKGDEIKTLARVNDSIIGIGFKNKGIRLLNTSSGNFATPTNAKSECLKDLTISSLFYLNDWLWAGTAGKGLWAINLKTGAAVNFTEKDGLPSNMVYGILPEDSRQLWVSSNEGLFKITYKKIDGIIHIDKINSYTQLNGLQSKEFTPGSYHLSANKTLFFGGIKGLNFFKAGSISSLTKETRVYLSEIYVENKLVKGHLALQKLNLPFLNNSFAVNYTALDFLTPGQHIFSYRLEGYEEQWVEAGVRKYVSYNNLPPGNYNFQVKLSDKTLDFAPVTNFGITVNTPFWYTWWFIVIVSLSFFLFLYIIYRYRIEHLMELQKIKDRISADLHDDLGSRLTTIHFLSAISRNKFTNEPEISTVLSNIDREINASTEALDEIVWNIRKADESFGEILAKIRRYVGEVLESGEITYEIKINEEVERNNFPMEQRREFFLICKELINNVRKHSGATQVNFEIENNKGSMIISLSDNGKGFNPSLVTHRNGLSNIKKRVLKWRGRIKVNSELGKGTIIVIILPLKNSFSFRNPIKKLLRVSPKKGIESRQELA